LIEHLLQVLEECTCKLFLNLFSKLQPNIVHYTSVTWCE